ncbi:hypothetical protein HPB49_010807 [Dermacentor silvarum]|uniref:Uncharacterized protein n=1 Tax=Dermacentor silvarum TaxID=543639 RepID=A0ACB8DZC9_DERSI|nr:hypothetical protein HPB49_010807 [Dermacentor silvarum]
MLPTYHQLKLQLWWILSDPGESHDRYVKEYRAFFSEQASLLDVDATFSFGEVCRKQSRNLYEGLRIYQVDCAIEWPGITWFGPSAKHLQVGCAWCNARRDQGSNKALFQWLVPSLLEAFQLATHPVDRNVSLLSFSSGTLAELGTYVQHHQFSTYLYRGHHDYWVDSTFQHDQCSLHIDLHLNHRSGCEDHVAERRFVVPYLNVLKVLINEKNHFVELYLHLKIPPMLMGEVVSDIPARPGISAAAALLCWERYLAIGCNCISGAVRTASLCGGLFLKLVVRDHSLARRVVGRLSHRCALGTLICYAPIRTYSSKDAAFKWSHEVQVGRAWCNAGRDQGSNKALFQWLAPSLLEAFQLATHPVDRNVSFSSFSSGTLAELGTYVQHHQFSAYLYRGHRDYWVDSTFQHDQCSLHIDLHLNHRSWCEDHVAEHRFVVPCLNVLKVHFENRILRKFNSEFAIRVSFRDDNLDKLSFTLNVHSSLDALVDAVVGSFLRQGVHVGTRKFKFLAPSLSQLRDHGYRGRRAVCAC